jgi:hypothetical protein
MHEQTKLVRVGNQAGCFLRRGLRRRSLVGSAIGVAVLLPRNLERNDIRLPRTNAVGIGLDLRKALRG